VIIKILKSVSKWQMSVVGMDSWCLYDALFIGGCFHIWCSIMVTRA